MEWSSALCSFSMENMLFSEEWPFPHASGMQQQRLTSETVVIFFLWNSRMKMSFRFLLRKKNNPKEIANHLNCFQPWQYSFQKKKKNLQHELVHLCKCPNEKPLQKDPCPFLSVLRGQTPLCRYSPPANGKGWHIPLKTAFSCTSPLQLGLYSLLSSGSWRENKAVMALWNKVDAEDKLCSDTSWCSTTVWPKRKCKREGISFSKKWPRRTRIACCISRDNQAEGEG